MQKRAFLIVFAFVLTCFGQVPRAEILTDTFGVPHIYAANDIELMRAFGYAQMQSHGNLILELYGTARGRAAEYWGPKYRDSDVRVRTYGIGKLASTWGGQQKPAYRRMLTAFADGMNRYAKEHPEQLDPKMLPVLPVNSHDVLAHLIRVIHFTFVARDPMHQQAGSNAWAVAPARTANGHALLLANPHLPWHGFYLWYEAQLNAPGIDFYGASLVGSPMLSIGFNQNLGWTHTVNTYDGADLYEVRMTPQGDGYYWNGGIKLFDISREKIIIKQPDGATTEEEILVRATTHGPVISMDQEKLIALRVAGQDQPHMLEQYWDMARAATFEQWLEAQKRLQMPMFTTMYADNAGHIFHLFGGLTPMRSTGDWKYWSGIVPGENSDTLWTRYLPYEQLPKVLDPPTGWLQNANDPPWSTTFPLALNDKAFPPYLAPAFTYMNFRPQRSARLLDETKQYTFDKFVTDSLSTRMELADRVLDELTAFAHDSEEEDVRTAADVLAVWDRCADNQSRGAVLFQEWVEALQRGKTFSKLFNIPWSRQEPRTTPKELNREVAMEAFREAVRTTKQRHGELNVEWGKVHRLRVDGVDLPANGAPGLLGVFRVTDYSEKRDFHREAIGGDSFMAAIEFTTPVRAQVLLTTGNASQPGSPHRTDQLQLYSQKRMRTPWLTRREVESHLESRKQF
jgi:acyl-homoserine-lactone acylase